MSEAFRAIREAHRRCARHEPGPAVALGRSRAKNWACDVVAQYEDCTTQRHHGVTDAALAAWYEVRLSFKRMGVAAVGGVIDYPIRISPGMDLEESALYVEDKNGRRIYLTGCSWGYGGEGPHGTAAILADVGLYRTIEDAMRFVGSVPMKEAWRREL